MGTTRTLIMNVMPASAAYCIIILKQCTVQCILECAGYKESLQKPFTITNTLHSLLYYIYYKRCLYFVAFQKPNDSKKGLLMTV